MGFVHGSAAIALIVALRAAASDVEAGTKPPRLDLYNSVVEGEGLHLARIDYVIDGRKIAFDARSLAGNDGLTPIYSTELTAGVHELHIDIIYEGRSPMFNYVEAFRFHFRGRAKFKGEANEVVTIQTRLFRREGVTVRWEGRPYLNIQGAPRRLIVEIEVLKSEVEAIRAEEMSVNKPAAPANLAAVAQVPALAAEPAPEPAPPSEPAAVPAPGAPSAGATQTTTPPCGNGIVLFEFASSKIAPDALTLLEAVARCLVRNPSLRLRVEGHCDIRGSLATNRALSDRRTTSVVAALKTQGIASERLQVQGFGKERPVCQSDDDTCHDRNRRVELTVEP